MTTFEVNGRTYRVPERRTLGICIDGTGVEYLEEALGTGLMPRLRGALDAGGRILAARAQVPTLTNVNNSSILTGVSAAVHGIAGNHYLAPDGAERQLTDASALRAETILAAALSAGVPALGVTAKDKLRDLLVICEPVDAALAGRRDLRGFDLFELLLNGLLDPVSAAK